MENGFETETVGALVARDYRTAAVLESFAIDFCCGGRRSIHDACVEAGADPARLRQALDALPPHDAPDEDVTRWPVDRLIDHILSKHHTYVRAELPAISKEVAKLASVHGTRHPELLRVAAVVEDLSRELHQHLIKEEHVLFPYIRELAAYVETRASPFGTVDNPIRMMEREHVEAGQQLKTIRALTGDYTVPADGCATYKVAMRRLEAFERDLHRHIHLENNILFPSARALEAQHARWRD
jgi:regulator of cell morphogenesis and NO signaling